MRADPMTEGSLGRELVPKAMDGQTSYDRDAVRLSDENRKTSVPSSRRSSLTQS